MYQYERMPVLEPEYTLGIDLSTEDSYTVMVSYNGDQNRGRVWTMVKPRSALQRVASDEDPFSVVPEGEVP